MGKARWLGLALGGTAAAVLLALPFLPRLAESAALRVLAEKGVRNAALTVGALNSRRLVIRDARLGGLSFARLEAAFSLPGLLRRQVEAVTLEGLRLPLHVAKGTTTIPGLEPLLQGTGGGGAWSLGQLKVADAEILLDPWLAPVHAEGSLEGRTLTARLAALDKRVVLEAAGPLDGQIALTLHPVRFEPGKLQPRDLLPFLGDEIPVLAATVAGQGPVRWEAGALKGDIKVTARGGALALGGVKAEAIEGDLRLAALDDIRLEGLTARVADGGIALAPLVLVAPRPGRHETTLTLDGVSLRTLLEAFQVPDTRADGLIRGTIPIAIDKGRLIVADGRVEATGPGALSYRPAAPPAALQAGGEGASLMASALGNFQYRVLNLKADRGAEGQWQASIHLTGSNPEVLDGHPFEFNINIGGALDEILRRGLESWELPQAIADRVLSRSKGKK